eukprot:2610499-Prymnesium_polylepis.2
MGVSGDVVLGPMGASSGGSSTAATSMTSVATAEAVPLESRTKKLTLAIRIPEASRAGTNTTAALSSWTASPSWMTVPNAEAASQHCATWWRDPLLGALVTTAVVRSPSGVPTASGMATDQARPAVVLEGAGARSCCPRACRDRQSCGR